MLANSKCREPNSALFFCSLLEVAATLQVVNLPCFQSIPGKIPAVEEKEATRNWE